MFKKILFLLSFFFILIFFGHNALAQETADINIYFFWGEGCPHCEKERSFLTQLTEKYPEIKIYDFEIWMNAKNRQLIVEFGKKLNVNISGVPFTVVGEKYFIGWYNEQSTGAAIEDIIKRIKQNSCRDIGKEILSIAEQNNQENKNAEDSNCESEKSPIPQKLDIPFLGEIETKNFSLPALTIILGALDGFNPCAMWTLLFLISLLLGMKDKKRMWVLGIAFIVASASVYFLFMAAWLNLILFIGFIVWVRIIIGLIALLSGGYNLKKYFSNPEAGCQVTDTEKRQKVFEKLKNITLQKSFYLALGGIIILAFAVNLVELICSAGLPAIYTQILVLSNLAKWKYYLYILLYIFIFMLDDIIIFFIAMITLQMTGVASKYSRWSHLIGGVLMLIIGILLIFKPEWLMFG